MCADEAPLMIKGIKNSAGLKGRYYRMIRHIARYGFTMASGAAVG